MEEELKDYLLMENAGSDRHLDFIIDLANARKTTGQPYRAGSLLDQPYFQHVFVEPWVAQGQEELTRAHGGGNQLEQLLKQLGELL